MKFSDLKVGDRVKYYYPPGIIADTTIGEGELTWCGMVMMYIN